MKNVNEEFAKFAEWFDVMLHRRKFVGLDDYKLEGDAWEYAMDNGGDHKAAIDYVINRVPGLW